MFKETAWALFVENLFEQVAHWLHIERAPMVTAVSLYLGVAAVCYAALFAAFKLGQRDRNDHPKLALRFDAKSEAFVRPIKKLSYESGEFYSLGVANLGNETLHDITIKALDSWFTRVAIAEARGGLYEQSHGREPVIIFKKATLHPNETEIFELFGLDFNTGVSAPEYIFNHAERFVLEIAGKDTQAVQRTFEYDPKKRPMLSMLPD